MGEFYPAAIGTIIYAVLIIAGLAINFILMQRKKNPYAKILTPVIIIGGISMWIMYMGAYLSQMNPVVYPEPNLD